MSEQDNRDNFASRIRIPENLLTPRQRQNVIRRKNEMMAEIMGAMFPHWQGQIREHIAAAEQGLHNPLEDFFNEIHDNDERIRQDREATERFIDTSSVEVTNDGRININVVQPPRKGSVINYPVRIKQHLPGLGFLVSDELGSERDYWVAEGSIADRANPVAEARVEGTTIEKMKVSIQHTIDGKPVSRSLSTHLVKVGIKQNQVTVVEA